MNPYRAAFYQRQAEWHGYADPESVRAKHELRSAYYKWYTKGWLPEDRNAPILDIGSGSGQFLHFLRKEGFLDAHGIDVDATQVEIGRSLGLDCRCVSVFDHLDPIEPKYALISMLDILEHFTREELFPILDAVAGSLRPGGRLIASVPNAESPDGLRAIYADITHEIAFSPTSLSEMFFCHGLKVVDFRDPWPAPVSPIRAGYRMVSTLARKIEAARLKLLGYDPPRYWSSVIWAMAEKPAASGVTPS